MLTFEPHPAVTLGRTPPTLLTTLPRKLELAQRSCPGIHVVVRQFTLDFARLSPEAFARDVLARELGAAVVMVGINFRFGRDRSGGFGDLERWGAELGFEAFAEPLVCDTQGAWSSTRVRELVSSGNIDAAQQILGRPHALSGVVAHGDARGRTLGFPTCNLPVVPELLPPFGVYAVLVDLLEPETGQALALGRGVANVGLRPTVKAGAARPLVEVHLFDLDRDLYGRGLRVHLVARLRSEQRFADLASLKAQIAQDSDAARRRLENEEPDPLAMGAWA